MARFALTSLLLIAACGGGGGSDPAPAIVANFLIEDVNTTSTTFNTEVSPRDYLGKVSAWYFGSAT